MQIARFALYRFRIPFIRPVKAYGQTLREREGYLLALEDEAGSAGWGEIAPLPHWTRTEAADGLAGLRALRPQLLSTPLSTESLNLQAPLFGLMPWSGRLDPRVAFGIESALLALCTQHRLVHLHPAVRVNGLWIPDASRFSEQITYLRKTGIRVVKVKIGRLAPRDEIREIRRLSDAFGGDLTLRLDANRSLALDAYQAYCQALGDLPVEYVEEPLANGDFNCAAQMDWPLAVDESLPDFMGPDPYEVQQLPAAVRAVILKPGALPGLHGMFRAVDRLRARGVKSILSSAYNTGVGIGALARVAASGAPSGGLAHGLDTLKYLAGDVLVPSWQVVAGRLALPGAAEKSRVNLARLEQVAL